EEGVQRDLVEWRDEWRGRCQYLPARQDRRDEHPVDREEEEGDRKEDNDETDRGAPSATRGLAHCLGSSHQKNLFRTMGNNATRTRPAITMVTTPSAEA